MKQLTLLIKPASSLCNLRCRYCFYTDEAANRQLSSMGIMQEKLAEELIRQSFETVGTDGSVLFMFQGGEPTVAGLPFFQRFVQLVKEKQPPRVQIAYSIQTNGTMLNDEWALFLHQEQFLVGLSLDGCPDIHDGLRVDPQGKGTYHRVLAAKELLEKYRVEYNALCVVTGECAKQAARVYGNLKTLGFRYLQFIPCLDPIGHERGEESWSLKPGKYGAFLCKIFDLWYQDLLKGQYYSIRLFDDYIHLLLGEPGSTCATCGKCGSYLVVEGDGSTYPCDFFSLDQWKLGSIPEHTVEELMNGEKAREFLQWGTEKPEECRSCSYRALCNGGCKNDWYQDETGFHNYFCPSFKMLFEKKLPKMQAVAQLFRTKN